MNVKADLLAPFRFFIRKPSLYERKVEICIRKVEVYEMAYMQNNTPFNFI